MSFEELNKDCPLNRDGECRGYGIEDGKMKVYLMSYPIDELGKCDKQYCPVLKGYFSLWYGVKT